MTKGSPTNHPLLTLTNAILLLLMFILTEGKSLSN